MAYNSNNEVQEVISTLDKNKRGDKIRVTKIINSKYGYVSVDVRNMYTTEDGDVRPTTRGIRFNSEMAPDVIMAMLEALGQDTVQDLLTKVKELGETN